MQRPCTRRDTVDTQPENAGPNCSQEPARTALPNPLRPRGTRSRRSDSLIRSPIGPAATTSIPIAVRLGHEAGEVAPLSGRFPTVVTLCLGPVAQ